jgi:hypothetical protein
MKAIVILGDILVMMWIFSVSMNEAGVHDMLYFNEMLILVGICLLNLYYLTKDSKKGWSDKILGYRFFKKGKTAKIILIPLILFFIVMGVISSDARRVYVDFWKELQNPKYCTSDWVGRYTSNIPQPFCEMEWNFKTKEECITWGESRIAQYGKNPQSIYMCGKNCCFGNNCNGGCQIKEYSPH